MKRKLPKPTLTLFWYPGSYRGCWELKRDGDAANPYSIARITPPTKEFEEREWAWAIFHPRYDGTKLYPGGSLIHGRSPDLESALRMAEVQINHPRYWDDTRITFDRSVVKFPLQRKTSK